MLCLYLQLNAAAPARPHMVIVRSELSKPHGKLSVTCEQPCRVRRDIRENLKWGNAIRGKGSLEPRRDTQSLEPFLLLKQYQGFVDFNMFRRKGPIIEVKKGRISKI